MWKENSTRGSKNPIKNERRISGEKNGIHTKQRIPRDNSANAKKERIAGEKKVRMPPGKRGRIETTVDGREISEARVESYFTRR